MHRVTSAALSVFFLLTLTACSGTGSIAPSGATLPRPAEQLAAARRIGVRIVIHVPRRHRRPHGARFISPSTKSIVIGTQETSPVSGGAAVTYANIVAGAPNCTGSGPTLPYTCSVFIGALAPGATYTLSFVTYDATQTSAAGPYNGSALSQNTVSKTIAAGVDNTIGLILDGVPESFAVSPAGTPAIDGGVANGLYFLPTGAPKMTIVPVDADGNFIVGAGAPAVTASITAGATGGLALAGPDSANRYTVSATDFGNGTLKISAPVPGSSTPLTVNVPLHAATFTTQIAGSALTTGSNDGTGTQALFNGPEGMLFGADGELHVTDTSNCTVRVIDPTSLVVSTAAGTVGTCNETGSNFNKPWGIAEDNTGVFYVTDQAGDSIRSIANAIATFTGGNGAGTTNGGPGTAQFKGPEGIAFDPDDNDLYVADSIACTIRRVTLGGTPGTVSTIEGTPGTCDHSGSDFDTPTGVAYAGNHTLYVTDQANCEVRRITAIDTSPAIDTVASPFAGNSAHCALVDGTGSSAGFSGPSSIAYDGVRGKLYVADGNGSGGPTIRQIDVSTTAVTTIAGGPKVGNNTGWISTFFTPAGITVDPATHRIFLTDSTYAIVEEVQL